MRERADDQQQCNTQPPRKIRTKVYAAKGMSLSLSLSLRSLFFARDSASGMRERESMQLTLSLHNVVPYRSQRYAQVPCSPAAAEYMLASVYEIVS